MNGRNRNSSATPSRLTLSPDQLSLSSVPNTPAPTPLLHVTHHMHPEQLVAGIKKLKADEGYIDSASFPGTPAPTPFSPSPAQFTGFSPDQVAEGIRRLREEGVASGSSSTGGQPSTPSATPGGGYSVVHPQLGIIPEHLMEGIRHLRCDEGLESGSNPATPVPTPTTGFLRSQQTGFPPEQLAAGIRRLKVEEGMSSDGSSGFPSTPAPTPFTHQYPGGVRPEDLAAGISRLSVIEETTKTEENNNGNNNLSQYFNDNGTDNDAFDHIDGESTKKKDTGAVLTSCSQSRVNLPEMEERESSIYATPTAETPMGDKNFFHVNQPITSPLPHCGPVPSLLPAVNVEISSATSCPSSVDVNEIWIPNKATAQILESIKSSGNCYPDKSELTTPSISTTEEFKDPIQTLMSHYHGTAASLRSSSQIPNVDSVTQDLNGLKILIQSGCYRSALNLTSRLLENHDNKHSPTSLRIWFMRLAMLVKINKASLADVEAEAFGPDLDKPDLYYEFYPEEYPGRSGPMVPFDFRLLVAEIPQYNGKPHETLDRLYALWEKVKVIRKSYPTETRWKERESKILYSLVNSYVVQNDYSLAVETTNMLLEMEDTDYKKSQIYSLLGRIFLRLGDISSAKLNFDVASSLREDRKSDVLDSSLMAIANNDFESAYEILQRAQNESTDDSVVNNNASVCLISLGRLADGLNQLEYNLTNDPSHYQYEIPILNLSTLYELESSYALQKKQRLLELISQYKGDGLNAGCLKLQV